VRIEVERVFGVKDRSNALSEMDQKGNKSRKMNDNAPMDNLSPAFLTISAENAFVYRAASGYQRNEIHKLGKHYIDKIGYEEVGKFKWKRLSKDKQYDIVYDAVNDVTQYEERLASSNFDKFLKVLEVFIGGNKTQAKILEKQLTVELNKLNPEAGFTTRLESIFNRCSALGKPTAYLKDTFWKLYDEFSMETCDNFESSYSKLHLLYGPMKELEVYALGLNLKLLTKNDDEEEGKKDVLVAIKKLVIRQYEIVIKAMSKGTPKPWKEDPWVFGNCYDGYTNRAQWKKKTEFGSNFTIQTWTNGNTAHPEKDQYFSHWKWDDNTNVWRSKFTDSTMNGSKDVNPLVKDESWELSARDWNNIISMLLIMKYDGRFGMDFGKEISDIEWYSRFLDPCNNVCRVTVPLNGPSNPEHWGHLVWRYLNFVGKEGARGN